jgi:hypothetical protein
MTDHGAAHETDREVIDGRVGAAPSLGPRRIREDGIASMAPAELAANEAGLAPLSGRSSHTRQHARGGKLRS